jgi:3-deoxy-manno-octulosonate cytidylyltransferase (CMP-KDO synthetase)
VARAVRAFGGDLVMTRSDHITGTDRVAEVAKSLRVSIVVNLQGDEPVFDPETISRMVTRLAREREVDIVTACHPLYDPQEFLNPHVVKVVLDKKGHALYFSRSPIPSGAMEHAAGAFRHIGVYAFRREALARFTKLPRTPLEISERLEQLRALEHGLRIAVVESDRATIGVDVPSDIKNVERAMRESLD